MPDAGKPTTDVSVVDMEALLVLAGGGQLQLLDPSTGRLSPVYAASPSSGFNPVAVSPDGTRLAITVDDSGPSLSTTAEWSVEELGLTRPVVRLLWSPDGERLVYDTGAIDVATGDVYSCEEPVLAGIPPIRSPVATTSFAATRSFATTFP